MSEVKWTNEQMQAIKEKDSNILVAAAAGSGKTAVLVERIIHKIINEKMDINKMLIVTFTNAAASEMRERILDAIYKKLEEEPHNMHLQRQITLLNKASICTIHAFCLEVIHNYFYEISMPSNFKIADTAEIALLKQDTLDDLFEQKYEENNQDFLELLETYTNYRGDEALGQLVLTIYDFIQSSPFPENWLQEKVEMFQIDANQQDFGQTLWGEILLKYVREEIQEAILSLEITQKKLNKYVEMAKFTQTILEDIEILQDILNSVTSWENTYQKIQNCNFRKWPIDKTVTIDLKEEAKGIRNIVKKKIKEGLGKIINCSSSSIFTDFKKMEPILRKLANLTIEFLQEFSKRKKEKNCIDFNDIEHFALKILVGENGKPTEIAKKYAEKFEEIAIDEYQDSNLVQEAILTSISKGNNIFMVGDVKQSIYKFRGARPELFLNKYETYQIKEQRTSKDNLKIQLFRNFRSRENVLDFTNLVFEAIMSKELGDIIYNENEYLNYGANYPEPVQELESNKDYAGIAQMLILDLKQEESITAFKEEGEEDEEQEQIEDEVLEAKLVAEKIKSLLKSNYMVYDKKKGYRKIRPKDIVILLRATSNLAPIYEKELTDLNIPVFSDSSSSYLETVEIETILSVLKILDNPMQDIPLVVVLRSMIGNFTDNDLVEVRLMDQNCTFYEAMLKARLAGRKELKEKIEAILEKLENWKRKEKYLPLGELIWQIYLDTGYYQYVGLLPNGQMRMANLKTLFEKAKQYEIASYKGLFYFIHFIEKLRKQNGDLGQAKLIGEGEDVIRIMSIHKSKGLEFPVVFLCSTQKKFNLKDLNESILLHQDIGFGPTLIDTQNRIKYNMVAKEAIKLKMKQETLSEEERILYVALTRAKEKLYITGRSKDFEKECQKKKQEIEMYQMPEDNTLKLDYKLIQKGKSYLDWLLNVYFLGKSKRILLKGKEMPLDKIITLETYSKKELIKRLTKQENKENINVKEKIKEALEKQEGAKEEKEKIEEILTWKYPHLVDTVLPNKTSVTKLKEEKIKLSEITNIENEEQDLAVNSEKQEIQEGIPKFLQEKEIISNVHKGTLIHLCIQKVDEKKEYTQEDIKQLVQSLYEKEIITLKELEAIDIDLIYTYTKSELFQELKKAKEVYKEKPFYISIPAKEIIQEAKSSEKMILVQGIIDLYYINQKEELILIDFKTDYVKEGNEEELIEKYKVQLEIYQKALEQALNKKVEKIGLCLAKANFKVIERKEEISKNGV
ncbi:MAG: helicase-exonuclease AddAB subunit AddA [Clostridia bacterium]|nr:helicase-exonuclease AddAB subunit AddA [Clostridia bacterium]